MCVYACLLAARNKASTASKVRVHTEIIGVSLSEPHTSKTALRVCVCILVCLWPCTVNFTC